MISPIRHQNDIESAAIRPERYGVENSVGTGWPHYSLFAAIRIHHSIILVFLRLGRALEINTIANTFEK